MGDLGLRPAFGLHPALGLRPAFGLHPAFGFIGPGPRLTAWFPASRATAQHGVRPLQINVELGARCADAEVPVPGLEGFKTADAAAAAGGSSGTAGKKPNMLQQEQITSGVLLDPARLERLIKASPELVLCLTKGTTRLKRGETLLGSKAPDPDPHYHVCYSIKGQSFQLIHEGILECDRRPFRAKYAQRLAHRDHAAFCRPRQGWHVDVLPLHERLTWARKVLTPSSLLSTKTRVACRSSPSP